MTTRTALLVVAVTAALFASGLLAVLLVGRTLQSIRSRVNNEFDRQTFVAQWKPPIVSNQHPVLPERVLNRSTTNIAQEVRIPELELDLPGWSATYSMASSTDRVHVAALEPTTINPTNVFARARRWYEGVAGTKQFTLINDRARLSTVSPPRSMEIWAIQGWTFIFTAPSDPGSDFIRACLEAASAPPSLQP